MAEVNPATIYHVALRPSEYRLMMKALAFVAGTVKRMDPEERSEAAALNKQLLENQRANLQQQLQIAEAALQHVYGYSATEDV